MVQTVFYLIVIVLLFDFLFGRSLSLLNIHNSKKPLPPDLQGIYDTQKYAKQQHYFRTNVKFGWLTSAFSFLLLFGMYVFGGFAWLDTTLQAFGWPQMAVSLLFFAALFIGSDLIELPFQIYDTFVIEARFGFNRTTPKTFLFDKLKGWALTMLLGGLLLSAIILIYSQIPTYFWIVMWGAVSAFSLFMSLFYSQLIVPLFNKQTPLEAGELRTAIENFARQTNFPLNNIYVIDGSKRSSKANAYFTGWGKKKRIVLYDTLMQHLTTEEIVAVLAHEIGHNKHRHTIQNILLSLASNLLLFYLLSLILTYDFFAQAVGVEQASFHINLLVFSILYTPISMLLDLFGNALSRRFEYQADSFVKTHGQADALVSSLKKISSNSLSNLMPHPLYVFFYYSHPTLGERIRNLKDN